MKTTDFKKLLRNLNSLTDKQYRTVEDFFKGGDPLKLIVTELEQRMVNKTECPHCHGLDIKRYGKVGIMQRYQCKGCSKTFTATTKTPLARLRNKEKWLEYLSEMIEGKTLRESAKSCDINLKTSFRWRHRFLQIPTLIKATSLEGIVEIDETFFAYSEKGNKHLDRAPKQRGTKAKKRGRSREDWVPVLTVRDRGKHTYEAILPSCTSEQISHELNDKIETDSVLCSDGFKSYIKFARDNNLIHKRLNVAAGVRVLDKVFHIQNVNAYHSRMKAWFNRFNGIATKYLDHYLGWFRLLDGNKALDKNGLFKVQQQLLGT